jgi:hypothetical protein
MELSDEISIHQHTTRVGEMLQQRDIHNCSLRLAGGDGNADLGGDTVQQFEAFTFMGVSAGIGIRRGTLRQLANQPFPIIFEPSLQNIGGTDCGPGHGELRSGLLSNTSSVRSHLFLDNTCQKVLNR